MADWVLQDDEEDELEEGAGQEDDREWDEGDDGFHG